MARSFLPDTDAGLLAWSVNFKTLITATPTAYGLVAADATAYGAVHDAYAAAYQTAVDPSTRTKPNIIAKDSARKSLKEQARLLAKRVDGTSTVTDAQRAELGLNVPAVRTPIPPPATAPDIDVISMDGHLMRIRLHDAATNTRRGRPAHVAGATVFTYVGATAPANITEWKFEANTNKTMFDILFDASLAPGTKVWITAFWFNAKSESGPACEPVGETIGYGGLMAA